MTSHSLRIAATVLVAGAVSPAQEPAPDFAREVKPLLTEFCVGCHGVTDPEAGIDLVGVLGGRIDRDALDVVLDVRDVLRAGEMPPSDEPQPSDAARDRVIGWAEGLLAHAAGEMVPDPGRVTMRRLSRYEYANTVRDLLGVEIDVSEFPADDLGYGFDNVGETLSLSTLHLEKLAAAAEAIAAAALPDPDPETPPVLRFDAKSLECSLEGAARGDVLVLFTDARVSARAAVPRPGDYRMRAAVYATQAGDDLARAELSVGRTRVRRIDVTATRDEPAVIEADVRIDETPVEIAVSFVNDFYDPDNPDRSRRDRNLYVLRLEIEGPLDPREPTAAERWLRPLDRGSGRAASRAQPILDALMERAWRRPVRRAEVSRFARLVADAVEQGETFGEGLRWAVQAVLVSPQFLFRMEPVRGPSGAVVDLDDHALATRLSYFLWSSLPDAALTARAEAGELGDAKTLLEEARRLLADPRASALTHNFAGQWLELRRLADITPDPDAFPEWSDELAASARRETELLFDTVLREGLPARTLVDADFTFVDGNLARHYQLPADVGPDGQFVRVALDGGRVGGVLGHASFLALTSNATRTSPVKRGKWILDNLLDDPPPPPPPGNDSFAAEATIDSAQSLREQMEIHRQRPECAVCHVRMDALGLALESYDAIGRRRERDAGGEIDTRTTLPDGRALQGPADLARVVAGDPAFRRALLHKLFVYAVGRGIRPADAIALEGIALRMPDDATLEDLILAVVAMDAFRRRSLPG